MKCFEAKIEESEEAGTELLQPDIAQVVLLNGSVSQHSVCAMHQNSIRSWSEILSIRREHILSSFLGLNA